jgi:hypothetical protein
MIASGLTLNVAVFTLFSHDVLRPFPVRAPASLYEFSWADRCAHVDPPTVLRLDDRRLETDLVSTALARTNASTSDGT